jgi:hypothetical protein
VVEPAVVEKSAATNHHVQPMAFATGIEIERYYFSKLPVPFDFEKQGMFYASESLEGK